MAQVMTEIQQGDCIKFMQSKADGLFDLVVADPPYSSGGMMRSDKSQTTKAKYISSDSQNQGILLNFEGDNRDQRSYLTWSYLWMTEALRCTKDGGLLIVFTDWRQLPITTDAVQASGFVWRGIVPWYKGIGRPMADRFSGSCEYAIWATKGARDFNMKDREAKYPEGFYNHKTTADRIHVTEKPVDLYRHIYSVLRDGSHIFDPFLGSGNSAIAAHQENRGLIFTGTEISAEVFGVSTKRVGAALKQLSIPMP
jgi:site-specific DNA-methyltransferase (adenine-specific)